MFQIGFRLKLLFLFFSLLGIYFLEGNCQDNAQHPKITPIEEIEIIYANPECQQLQIASDPFDNQTAIWISQGVVCTSTKPNQGEWQQIPDILSSHEETVDQLHLTIDSTGNALAIWQAMPHGSIQASVKCKDSGWKPEILSDLKESGASAQITEDPDGNGIAIWKWSEKNSGIRFAELTFPNLLIDSDQEVEKEEQTHFSSLFEALTLVQTDPIVGQSPSNSQLPSTLPFPPTHLRGVQVANRFITQTDLINIITWDKPVAGISPSAYFIYRDRALTNLAAIIPANGKLEFKDHNRKPDHLYFYFIVSVDSFGFHSPPVGIVFKGPRTHRITPILPVSIAILPINPTITVGSTQQFFAFITFSNQSTQITTNVEWSSSDPNVAFINSEGLAIGLSPGMTTIRGTIDGISAATILTVTCPVITITTTSLPGGVVGTFYSQTINTTGGIAPLTFNIVNGSLPNGLTLDPLTGVISGTPTLAGTFNFTVQATSSCGSMATQPLSITLTCPPITITTTSLPSGEVGTPYSETIDTSGGVSPLTFSIVSGSLPDGLTLDPSSGIISGTPTTVEVSDFTVQVISSCGNSVTQPLSITITCPPITITTTSLPGGIEGIPYSETVMTTAEVVSVTFSIVSGSLPPGLSLDPSSGTISGTPTASGTFSFTVQVTSDCGSVATQPLSIFICPAIEITTTSLPGGIVGTPYSEMIMISGGMAPNTFSIIGGSLPPGLSLDPSSGTIFGTPTAGGSFGFTVQVISSCGSMDIQPLSIFICPIASITTTSLPGGIEGTSYSQTIMTMGGVSPMIFSIVSGSLPPGLSLDPSSGTISGIPTASGTFNFTVQFTSGCGSVATQPLSIFICPTITITTTSLPGGIEGTSYSQTIMTTGGMSPITFSIVSGSLPTGLSINSSTGTISGTPTAGGTFNFTVQATSSCGSVATQNLSIFICPAISIITTSLPGGIESTSYSQTIMTMNGVSPTFSIVSGSLPTGLSINSSTGTISGTPTAGGTFNFTVKAASSCGSVATQPLSIFICPTITITTTSLPGGTEGTPYSATILTTGGVSPITFSIVSGSLPPGLSLDSSTGTISGTPTIMTGIFSFTVQATSSCGSMTTQPLSITIGTPVCPTITITTTSLPAGIEGTSYSQTVMTMNGVAPITFSITSGSLPTGLSLNSSTGTISGTPTAGGTFNFTVKALSGCGTMATQPLSIFICPTITITTTSLPGGIKGTFYSQTIMTSGGMAPITFSIVSGSLPTGLSINSSTGTISGTPTASGTFSFTVQATSGCGSVATQPLSIFICPTITITTTSLPAGIEGMSYSQTIMTTGGMSPITFSIVSGSLPTGLSINSSTGTISGTPTAGGTFNFTVQATSGCGSIATQPLSIFICPTITITTTSLPPGMEGTPYSATIMTTGGVSPITFSIVSGSLPPGLSLNSSNGTISGTPTANGTFSFTVQATSSCGSVATQPLSISMCPAISITTTSLPGGTAGTFYTATIMTMNGVPPLNFSIVSGSLPSGLTLNATSGVISGTSTEAGTFSFTVQVTSSCGTMATKPLSITLTCPATTITTRRLPIGFEFSAYSAVISASGLSPSFTIISGSLPPGLSLSSTGHITGIPTQNGGFGFEVKATSICGTSGTRNLIILIRIPIFDAFE